MIFLFSTVFLTAIMLNSTQVWSAELLAKMSGTWSGTGWAKRTTDSPRETVRCRIEGRYIAPGRRLIVTGLCAVPGKKFEMQGTVSDKTGSGNVTGRWSNPFGIGSVAVNGSVDEDTAVLSFNAPHPDTKKSTSHTMTWRLEGRVLNLVTQLSPSGPVLSNIDFNL